MYGRGKRLLNIQLVLGPLEQDPHKVIAAGAVIGQRSHVHEVGAASTAIGVHLYGDVVAGLGQLDEVGHLAGVGKIGWCW